MGDLGTLIPLLSSVAAVGTIPLSTAVFWMGVFNIFIALLWDLPMPVQPMKSICAVALNEGMTRGAFAASGILTGGIVALIGGTRTIELVNKLIPPSVIAGMQVGLGVKMAGHGCEYWLHVGWLGIDSKTTALVSLALTLGLMLRTKLPTALIVFGLGTVLTVGKMLVDEHHFHLNFLQLIVVIPNGQEWVDGLLHGALPQLPLTLANSCISVCALSVDLFGDPDTGGKGARRVAVTSSIGLMNLVGCWFGGMPSCHGAGGLAAQFRFGARGGMAVLMLGLGKIVLAVFLGQTLDDIISVYPRTILGVLLLFAGVELASVGAKGLSAPDANVEDLLPCFVTAGAYIGTKNMALGVLAGLVTALAQPGGCRRLGSERKVAEADGAEQEPMFEDARGQSAQGSPDLQLSRPSSSHRVELG